MTLLRRKELEDQVYQPSSTPATIRRPEITFGYKVQPIPFSARANLISKLNTARQPSAELLEAVREAIRRIDINAGDDNWIETLSTDLGLHRD